MNNAGSLSALAAMSLAEIETVMGGAAQARNAKALHDFLHNPGPRAAV